jgi:hypothetical protein
VEGGRDLAALSVLHLFDEGDDASEIGEALLGGEVSQVLKAHVSGWITQTIESMFDIEHQGLVLFGKLVHVLLRQRERQRETKTERGRDMLQESMMERERVSYTGCQTIAALNPFTTNKNKDWIARPAPKLFI